MKLRELEDDLLRYLALMDISPDPEQLTLLARHIELVQDANRRVNLTRIDDAASAVRRHTADSLTVLPEIVSAPAGVMLDLGTGAGFPGVPLAICSERSVVLIDSVTKKIREVAKIVDALGLSDRVLARAGRAEALGRANRREFAIVVARAVSELPALVELASPLLARDGRLVCLKGTPDDSEIHRANQVAELAGMRYEYQRSLDLPEEVGHRTIVCYRRKSGESRVRLPRREGMAQHSPLA